MYYLETLFNQQTPDFCEGLSDTPSAGNVWHYSQGIATEAPDFVINSVSFKLC